MKSQEQILARLAELKAADFFGFQTADLVDHIDYAHAKAYLDPEITEAQWVKHRGWVKTPAEQIKAYMEFAWDKANTCRGLSASRSVEHMKAWLWLDEQDELANRLEDVYEYYGKPCLVLVCRHYGIDWEQYDDGVWRNDEGGDHYSAEEALRGKGIPA